MCVCVCVPAGPGTAGAGEKAEEPHHHGYRTPEDLAGGEGLMGLGLDVVVGECSVRSS